MVHELIGIHNNRTSLEHVPNIVPELKEIVLSPETDEFFARNMYHNFGDLAINIKAEVDELQKFEKTRKEVKTLSM
jgi:vacuolar protein sorting-associated protein 45